MNIDFYKFLQLFLPLYDYFTIPTEFFFIQLRQICRHQFIYLFFFVVDNSNNLQSFEFFQLHIHDIQVIKKKKKFHVSTIN